MNATGRQTVIANLLDHEGPLTLRELAAKSGMDQTTLYEDLTKMARWRRVKREKIKGRALQCVKAKQSLYRWRLVA